MKAANKKLNVINSRQESSEKELKEVLVIKDKFFRILAHDLRNPLSIFLNVSDLMANNYSDLTEEEIKLFLHDINKASINLFNLLDNLLLWAKIQTGDINYNPELIDLTNLTEHVVKDLRPLASKKDISINIYSRKKNIMSADLSMMMIILKNLIHNAIKYSLKNGVISIDIDNKPNEIVIVVKDNGIGIELSRQKSLFKIDANTLSSGFEPGAGLGLILAHEFAEFQGGSLTFESIPDYGSTFTVTFPQTEH